MTSTQPGASRAASTSKMSYINPAVILPLKKSPSQPKKFVGLPPGPSPRDSSISEDSPYTGRHIKGKPKITSVVPPYISQRSQLNAPRNRYDDHEIEIHQDRGFGIRQYENETSPSQRFFPEDQFLTPPAGGASTQGDPEARYASLLQDLYQLGLEPQPLEQRPSGLSLQPHAAEQQDYGGGQYPHVHVEQFPDPVPSVAPRRQHQPQQQDCEHVQYYQAPPTSHRQQKAFPQQQQHLSQIQQHAIPQVQTAISGQQKPQSIHGQGVLLSQQHEQQPLQSTILVHPGDNVHIRYDSASNCYIYGGEPLQNSKSVSSRLREIDKGSAPTPWRSQPANKPVDVTARTELPTGIDDRKAESSISDGRQERRGSRDQFSISLFGRSAAFDRTSRQEISPSYESAASARLSGVTADDGLEMLRPQSLGSDTVSSTGPDEVLQPPIPAERMSSDSILMPPASQTAVLIFPEARENLERLRADIADLDDSSDDSPESVGSDLGAMRLSLSEGCSDHTTNNVREETSVGSSGSQDLRMHTGEKASSSGGSPAHRRSHLDDNNGDHARTEIGTSRKRTRLSNLRFVCCFHNGPGRKCSGTDDTISEVLKKLSEQHDTHICDRCWILKVKEGSSGLYVHPDGDQTCRDHCLSPQCHKAPSSIGYRHEFNPKTCGTKTSRVRPGDSEAVYRFIFRLVHLELDCPSSVLTAEHSLHLDAVPRQSRRKLNREELTARANDLEKRLEAGEQQNTVNANRITQLEKRLADAHLATTRAEEKSAALEKQSRRIIAMLSDALRTGVFLNSVDHLSLLRRVEEDAPGALVHHSPSLLTPSTSDRSRNSSTTPVRGDVAAPDSFWQPAAYEWSNHAAPTHAMPGDHTMNGNMSDPWPGDLNMDPVWDDLFDESRNSDITSSQPRMFCNW